MEGQPGLRILEKTDFFCLSSADLNRRAAGAKVNRVEPLAQCIGEVDSRCGGGGGDLQFCRRFGATKVRTHGRGFRCMAALPRGVYRLSRDRLGHAAGRTDSAVGSLTRIGRAPL